MIVNLSVFPMGKGEGVSGAVSQALAIIDKSGLDYQLTAMGTLIEGDWDAVMALVKKVHHALIKKYPRVYMTMSLDDRRGCKGVIRYKVSSVEHKLGRALKK
jgi:uncharacterized protein (TIGR00106 family)